VREKLETTGTFKLNKGELCNEGFDPCRVRDPIFFRDPSKNAYVPLTPEVFEQLKAGKLRL
jgi:hypothetical protein